MNKTVSVTQNSICILGGSFDPVHNAHTAILKEVHKIFGFNRILAVPCLNSPHKIGKHQALASDRVAMLELALRKVEGCDYSTIEVSESSKKSENTENTKTGVSYTVNTLQKLSETCSLPIFMILGMDSIIELETWFEYGKILDMTSIILIRRPGSPEGFDPSCLPESHKDLYTEVEDDLWSTGGENPREIILLRKPELDISSTMIRETLQRDPEKAWKLMDPGVCSYIKNRGLYGYRENKR